MTRNKTIVTLGLIALVSLAFMGCSDDSNPVVTPTQAVDTAPPAIPYGLDADFDGSVAVISWAANTTDSDLAGFLVQKFHYDDPVVSLVGTPSMATSIFDNNVADGLTEYQVTAVDLVGNESAFAVVQVVKKSSKTDLELSD
jgi:ABC-type proline/glycine betaine transport system substrate-binding protein